MSCSGGSHECNFTTSIRKAGNFWMINFRPIGVETILLMDSPGVPMLFIAHGHVYRAFGLVFI